MLLAGVGFLLPYNSFITDVDYLHEKFKGSRLVERGDLRTSSLGAKLTPSVCASQARPSCSTWVSHTSWWRCWPSSSTMCWWRDSACTPESLWVSVENVKLEQLFSRLLKVLGDPLNSSRQNKKSKNKTKKRLKAPKCFFIQTDFSAKSCFSREAVSSLLFLLLFHLIIFQYLASFARASVLFSRLRIVCELRVLIRKQTRLFRQIFRIGFVKRLRSEFNELQSWFKEFTFLNSLPGQTAASCVRHQCYIQLYIMYGTITIFYNIYFSFPCALLNKI